VHHRAGFKTNGIRHTRGRNNDVHHAIGVFREKTKAFCRWQVQAHVSLRTRIRAEQESPKWEIRLTTGFVFLTVVFARITNPAYGAF
jgi:hypothetical protein